MRLRTWGPPSGGPARCRLKPDTTYYSHIKREVRPTVRTILAIGPFAVAVHYTLDPDMRWHLRTGQLILEEGIPRADTFSFTAAGHQWITHEWLS